MSAVTSSALPHRMLYIQMEFCPRTLKEALDAGPISEDQAWQVCCVCCNNDLIAFTLRQPAS